MIKSATTCIFILKFFSLITWAWWVVIPIFLIGFLF